MLGGDDHGVHPYGVLVLVVLHGDLGLAVGTQVVQGAVLTHGSEPLSQLVGQRDGQGHELLSLPAGIAEHHTLVAGAAVQLVGHLALPGLQGLVHAHGDVGGLLVDVEYHAAGVAVKAVLGPVIADVPDDLPGHLGDVHIAGGGDLTHDVHQTGGHGGLTGHTGHRVLSQNGVQNSVGNLVADLVGVSLGDRLRGKETSCHK